ncbi:transcriptional regulator [Nocardioides sp. CFH 31398]|uniref:transcriptional regulator n=1 Tax=Nocardioides sp. CFH 31398 TaxID=2919579 RepID=UPI001F054035|nr:transcriptional regulator [Nocardioides sp. CFH 31398]MCH1868422.1 transcriptional regulator [Nocardioides sp. CFH 31398]
MTGSHAPQTSALAGLDPALNAPKRLAIMAVLTGATSADFAFLRDHLGVSDSDLSKQAGALEAAGYLTISKSGRGRGSTTTYKATRAGRAAYTRHRDTLRALLG